jgi:DNA-binding NarL/FixJ family response regulator
MVGRLEAQQLLRSRLKACRDGRRGVVLVHGDTGIGKSTLLQQERTYAELLGMHVLAGRADEQRAGRPFVALRSALDASLRAEQDPTLRRLAADVDQQLRFAPQHLTASAGPSTVSRSVTRLLVAWARRAPLVLMIDDLQAADRDTCDLLGQLLRQLAQQSLLVVASLRGPLPSHVDALVHTWERQLGSDVAHVELPALDRHDAMVLARTLHLGAAEPGGLEALVTAAAGNPLHIEEAVAALQAEQTWSGTDSAPDQDATAALVLRRVHRLHDSAVGVAAVIALLERPRPSRLRLVARCSGHDESTVAAVLDTLLAAEVLRLESGAYQFALPVVRRVLVDSLGPSRQWQLHREIGAHLLERRAAGEPVDLVELAPHLAASATPGDRTAAEVLLEVASRYTHHAPQAAADWYRQALAVIPKDDETRNRVLADRARVLYLAGRLQEAVVDGQDALEGQQQPEVQARTGTIVTAAMLSLGRITDAVELAERLLTGADSPLLRVHVQLAAGLNYLNRFAESQHVLDGVLAAAPDPTTAALAHGVQAQLALSTGDTRALHRALDAAYAVPGLAVGARLSALTNDATHSVLACELERAAAALSQARALADSLGAVAFDADLELTELMLQWRRGRWEGLDGRIARCVAELEGRGQGINLAMLGAMRLELLTAAGELGDAAVVDSRLGGREAVGYSFVAWSQAGYLLARGNLPGALELLRAAWAHDTECGRMSSAPLLLTRLAEVCAAVGLGDEATSYADALGRLVDDTAMTKCRTFALRARGVVAGDVGLLRRAAEAAEDEGMPVEAATALLAAGRLSADAERDLLPALHGFAGVGAEAWRRQAAALLRANGVAVPRAARIARRGSLLTDAELRLARLVQDGLSNKQIAKTLTLSPKTIEVYLSRVFVKTGVRSRVELAVALSEGRLVPR